MGPIKVPQQKGNQPMFATFTPGRETATSLAGAFISALLFVSAAVGPLPIA